MLNPKMLRTAIDREPVVLKMEDVTLVLVESQTEARDSVMPETYW